MRVALCVIATALGCGNDHVFVCQTNDQCVDGELHGSCDNSYCSFPDPDCPLQRRYGDLAPPALAGRCVEMANAIANSTCDTDTTRWLAFQSMVELSAVARTGASSCLVCGSGMPDFTMDDDPPSVGAAVPGEAYLGQAWVRAAPGEAVPSAVYLEIREATTFEGEASEMLVVTGEWQQVSLMHTVAMPTQPLEVLLAGKTTAPAKPCFLVDDITLFRVR